MSNVSDNQKTELSSRKDNSDAVFSFTVVSVSEPVHPPINPDPYLAIDGNGYYLPINMVVTLDKIYKGKLSNAVNSKIEFVSMSYFGASRGKPAGLWVGVTREGVVPKSGEKFIAFYKSDSVKSLFKRMFKSLKLEDVLHDKGEGVVLYQFSDDTEALLSGVSVSSWQDKVEYSGVSTKSEVISIVDLSLKKNGNLKVYGDLSEGLQKTLVLNGVRITDKGSMVGVEIYPLSQAGHDFSMTIDKATLEISNVVVGEVLPPPTF